MVCVCVERAGQRRGDRLVSIDASACVSGCGCGQRRRKFFSGDGGERAEWSWSRLELVLMFALLPGQRRRFQGPQRLAAAQASWRAGTAYGVDDPAGDLKFTIRRAEFRPACLSLAMLAAVTPRPAHLHRRHVSPA